jgi:hypothetical protein
VVFSLCFPILILPLIASHSVDASCFAVLLFLRPSEQFFLLQLSFRIFAVLSAERPFRIILQLQIFKTFDIFQCEPQLWLDSEYATLSPSPRSSYGYSRHLPSLDANSSKDSRRALLQDTRNAAEHRLDFAATRLRSVYSSPTIPLFSVVRTVGLARLSTLLPATLHNRTVRNIHWPN